MDPDLDRDARCNGHVWTRDTCSSGFAHRSIAVPNPGSRGMSGHLDNPSWQIRRKTGTAHSPFQVTTQHGQAVSRETTQRKARTIRLRFYGLRLRRTPQVPQDGVRWKSVQYISPEDTQRSGDY